MYYHRARCCAQSTQSQLPILVFQLMNILNKIFGSSNSRKLKKMNKIVTAINAFEQELEHLSDEQLSGKTGEFAQKLEAGSDSRQYPARSICSGQGSQ